MEVSLAGSAVAGMTLINLLVTCNWSKSLGVSWLLDVLFRVSHCSINVHEVGDGLVIHNLVEGVHIPRWSLFEGARTSILDESVHI